MRNAPAGTPVTTTVAALSDHLLLQRVKELSAVEHHIEAVVSDHLREIERRRLYLTLGCSSMFDYAVRELGYSTGAAWRRLKAMRLCAEVQGARVRLQEGTLTLDAAAQLQHAFERQRRKQSQGGGGSCARSGAGSGRATPTMTPEAERPAAPVLDLAARESLVAQAAGKSTRQVQEMLAEVDPELAAPTDRVRPLGAGRWELKAVVDDDCQRGLEQLKGLLSHVDPQMTTGQLLGRLVQEALDRHDPSRPPRGGCGCHFGAEGPRRAERHCRAADRATGKRGEFPGRYAGSAARSGLPERGGCRRNFGAEGRGRAGYRGGRRNRRFGAEGGRRPAAASRAGGAADGPACHCRGGAAAPGTQPRHSGGGQAAGMGA